MVRNMKTSPEGIALIKEFEGLRLLAYLDVAGVWTIGYGHTATARRKQKITREQAYMLLIEDLAAREPLVSRALSRPPAQNQFDAMMSLAFNIGVNAFTKSTLLNRFNAGDTAAAANQFLRWVYAGGRKVPGLTRRRRAERALFLRDVATP